MKLVPLVYVTDMERAVGFYTKLLPASSVVTSSPYWTELNVGGAALALHLAEQVTHVNDGMALAFDAVTTLENVIASLDDAGIEPSSEICSQPFGRSVTVTDPDRLWQNPNNPLDIDNNSFVVPLDALLIINALNNGSFINEFNKLPIPPPDGAPPPYLDPSGDSFMTALDVLLVINFLNEGTGGQSEGEASVAEIEQIGAIVSRCGALEQVRQRADAQVDAARDALTGLPETDFREALDALATFAVERDH